MYKNVAVADLTPETGAGFDGHAGVVFGVGKKWSLGFIVNKRSDQWESFRDTSNTLFPGNVESPISTFHGSCWYIC